MDIKDEKIDVFCDGCEHYSSFSGECTHLIWTVQIKTPFAVKDVEVYASPRVHNKDNSCIYYADATFPVLMIIIIFMILVCLVLKYLT